MKYLLILRHGPAGNGSSDFSRELTPQGIEECRATGEFIKTSMEHLGFPRPELIISSPAIRAFQTAYRIQKELLPDNPKISTVETLYLPTIDNCLEVLWSQNKYASLILCSHNPGISDLGEWLFPWTGTLPPCGLLAGSFDIASWDELKTKGGRLLFEKTRLFTGSAG